MFVRSLAIPDLKLIEPRRFGDERGDFREVFSAARFEEHGLPRGFVQDNHSRSRSAGTLRGLHFQSPPMAQSKLIWVLRGAIIDVAVDLRHGSPHFGQHQMVPLREDDDAIFLVPKGFAHGFITIKPDTEVFYKADAAYAPEHDLGVAYDDPALAIDWPEVDVPLTLSAKDRAQPAFKDLPKYFRFEETG